MPNYSATAHRSRLTTAIIAAAALCGCPGAGFAQTNDAPPPDQPAAAEERTAATVASPETAAKSPPAVPRKAPRSRAWGVRLETEPPSYVKPLSEHGLKGFEDVTWLDFGLEHTTRYEIRDDDYRRNALVYDDLFLMRTRMFIGVHDVFDPIRFAFEFIDARQAGSRFPDGNGEVDEADVLQAYGELYFKDALGPGQPVRFQVGRMSLDYVDRRLVSRNRWRNTVNAFDGFRMQLGQPTSDWQVDFFAWMPVERRLTRPDVPDEERWFYGLVGYWRGWANAITLEPYYYVLDEDRKDLTRADREIHTLGIRGFGLIGDSGFDYDFDAAFQFGKDGDRKHRAYALFGELGYTFDHPWKPRLSAAGMYATGDRRPNDGVSERFDRLFAPNHCLSFTDYVAWQNVISPKLRLELQPSKKLRLDADYGAYWLASDSDAWVVPGRRDPQGHSGDFVGQVLEARARYALDKHADLEIGYAYFIPGTFVENTGPADDSDLLYVIVTLTF